MDTTRFEREQLFHDKWASGAENSLPDVVHTNEALTSPELRFIHKRLGDIKGLKVLDLGCGLGEASVYFAIKGADVTSVDLSSEMLKATKILAERNNVSVRLHQSAAESLRMRPDDLFDIVYVGNLFHHVDIPSTLKMLLPQIKPNGRLVSWDPVAYNPLINIYRRFATEVRTVDEHPLKKKDIQAIAHHFSSNEIRFFWLTSLVIFVLMVTVQARNPNKIRFWKAVVEESDRWEWLYGPLEKLDRILLGLFPSLRWLCWNVVIIAKNPVNL